MNTITAQDIAAAEAEVEALLADYDAAVEMYESLLHPLVLAAAERANDGHDKVNFLKGTYDEQQREAGRSRRVSRATRELIAQNID